MTTSYNSQSNSQSASDQVGNAYRDVTSKLGLLGLDTAIPEAVRTAAEQSVAQSRKVFDRSKTTLDASIATFEKSLDAAGQGAVAFNRKIVDIAQRNLSSVFDLAKSLAGAKNLTEIVELQAAYWQQQFSLLSAQAEEVRALSTKLSAAAAEPIKSHVATGMDEIRKAH